MYLQQAKEFSSFLKNSSCYWKGTLSNFKNNIFSCGSRDTLGEENQTENKVISDINKKEINKIDERESGSVVKTLSGNPTVENKEEKFFNFGKNEGIDHVNNNIESNMNPPPGKYKASASPLTNLSNFAYVSTSNSNNELDNINIDIDRTEIINKNFQQENLINKFKSDTPISIDHTRTPCNLFNDDYYCESLTFNRKFWTQDEDKNLIELVKTSQGKNWKKISQFLNTKTPQQCAYRYNKLLSNMNKRKWSRNEDIVLIELIEIYGQNWREISQRMEARTFEEVKDRYEKKLDPKLKRCKFNKEEDEMIISLFEQFGNKWDEIAKYFVDRSANMIKNRFYSHLRKKISKSSMLVCNIDSTQNEQNFDSKSLMGSTHNNLSSKDVKIEDNHSSLNLNLNMNVDSCKESMDVIVNSPKSTHIPNKLNFGLFQISKENRKSDAYPDLIKAHISPFEDYSMKIELPEINRDDYFDQNLEGILNFNTVRKNNINLDKSNLQNNLNQNVLNNSLDFNNLIHLQNADRNCKNNILKKDTDTSRLNKSKLSNSFRKSFSLSNIKLNSNYEMILDDSEANNIPKELIVIDTDSPKDDFLSNEKEINFKEHYDNIFKCKKNSFDEDNILDYHTGNQSKINTTGIYKTIHINNPSDNSLNRNKINELNTTSNSNRQSNVANNLNVTNMTSNINITNGSSSDDEALYRQYIMLEDVFKKVTDVSMYQTNAYNMNINKNSERNQTNVIELKKSQLFSLNKSLNEKREILSTKMREMKSNYFPNDNHQNLNTYSFDKSSNQSLRNSLMDQIDILIDLISTTKKKIGIMQEIENDGCK